MLVDKSQHERSDLGRRLAYFSVPFCVMTRIHGKAKGCFCAAESRFCIIQISLHTRIIAVARVAAPTTSPPLRTLHPLHVRVISLEERLLEN